MADESTPPPIAPTGPVPGGGAVPSGGAGGGGAPPAAPARVGEPAEYSFLAVTAITEICNHFDEVFKGQPNREQLSDFNNLIESAVTLTLGHELGGAIKPENALDEQMTGHTRTTGESRRRRRTKSSAGARPRCDGELAPDGSATWSPAHTTPVV